ncbi:MAG: aminomethyl-transferring glycine dehydrogenase [Bacteroidota bacterium]
MSSLFARHDAFANRHLGPSDSELKSMLQQIKADSLEELIQQTVPDAIRRAQPMRVAKAMSEVAYLRHLETVAEKNEQFRSYIGMGYYGTITPNVILRNVFHNPGWYTQYTPYQAEIAQGRLNALLNFQTVISDLTAMPVANASLLDEATAAAEAMSMFFGIRNKRVRGEAINVFLVSDQVFPQTIELLKTRAEPIGVEVRVQATADFDLTSGKVFGIMLQYPTADGSVDNYAALTAAAKEQEIYVTVAADLLALTLLPPPGEWGADAVVGNSQRFGVPMGYGGPHAAYFATLEDYKRQIPGRVIGISKDRHGNQALRMALQTREQHIRREKATSNICTAQALLANMAGFYAVHHGPAGLKAIAQRTHNLTVALAQAIQAAGYELRNEHYFDTLEIVTTPEQQALIKSRAEKQQINFYYPEGGVRLSLDETVSKQDFKDLLSVFGGAIISKHAEMPSRLGPDLRKSKFLTHPNFHNYRTETEMMRYLKRLENMDLSLMHSMIPLGSCTMKLNAATQLIPVTWPAFSRLHPFVPLEQAQGYAQIFTELERDLADITGFTACSLQPNSGAQGEYAGLMTIRAYHLDRGDDHRTVALIPESAHGTNPASAVMAGMDVVVVKNDEAGNIDIADLKEKAALHADRLAALMVTYPSTYGVFETGIQEICQIVHDHGGLVYMDGANMNAQVGLTSPGDCGADVCHLNLHKTFAIPHGGGGPGMGPICVNDKLAPYLPKHPLVETGGEKGTTAVSAAPWGSASILLISYAYIRMLGNEGLTRSSEYAILNANYIKERLSDAYDVLFVGEQGRSAHELIIDLRPFKEQLSAEDMAKRLIDYGFHAPTLAWPVPGTVMIEPTESESKAELDRFCDAMLAIRQEITDVAEGKFERAESPLAMAPHTQAELTAENWSHPYSREKAAWPLSYLRAGLKFWPSTGRVDNAFGDRNFTCTCPPIESYAREAVEA